MSVPKYNDLLKKRTSDVYRACEARSNELIKSARDVIEKYAADNSVDLSDMCIIVVGSVGRMEALEASDFDVTPISRDNRALKKFNEHDQALRKKLTEALEVKVSRGSDLTSPIALEELANLETIGGKCDTSATLTKRMLVLTEGGFVAGALKLEDVQREILDSYARADRSRGRHVLSLCNDIARYYRTLCIEYKAKADGGDKDWSTRNIKLRHSHKFWYFSNMLAISVLATRHPEGRDNYIGELGKLLQKSSLLRVYDAISEQQPKAFIELAERYAVFLEFMGDMANRKRLAEVDHDKRYELHVDNPFPLLKLNSDALHQSMMYVIDGLDPAARRQLMSWFLL